MSQLGPNVAENDRFVKNYTNKKDGKGKVQNMDVNNIDKLAKEVAEYYNEKGTFTCHSFRRSSASALVESGIEIKKMMLAGRWSSERRLNECVE